MLYMCSVCKNDLIDRFNPRYNGNEAHCDDCELPGSFDELAFHYNSPEEAVDAHVMGLCNFWLNPENYDDEIEDGPVKNGYDMTKTVYCIDEVGTLTQHDVTIHMWPTITDIMMVSSEQIEPVPLQ